MEKESSILRRRMLLDRVRRSQIFREYSDAFRETTGLPLNLRAANSPSMALAEDRNRNRFCSLIATSRQACSACLFHQKAVEDIAQNGPATLTCFAGLADTAVPFRLGDEVVGYLVTGQIFQKRPNRGSFEKLEPLLRDLEPSVRREALENAYMEARVLPAKQYESVVRLLSIFSEYLSTLTNQIMVQAELSDPPAIAHAKQFIREQAGNDISLAEVAKFVNLSPYYFCKSFKKVTGQTFTDYLARTRVEWVKSALANPHKRVSEAAYEAGFQSLSQFNRVFRRVAGESPSRYRDRILSAKV